MRGKGNKLRFLPLAPETVQLIDHYLRLERPNPCTAALFVSLKGPARGARMTLAGLRSLFRYHRQHTGIKLANPHRFRYVLSFNCVLSFALFLKLFAFLSFLFIEICKAFPFYLFLLILRGALTSLSFRS